MLFERLKLVLVHLEGLLGDCWGMLMDVVGCCGMLWDVVGC